MKEEDYNWDSHNESNDSCIDDDHDLIDLSNDNFLKIINILLIWNNNYFVIHGEEEGEEEEKKDNNDDDDKNLYPGEIYDS